MATKSQDKTKIAAAQRQRVAQAQRYMRATKQEVERFLGRACCHEHAIRVWASWLPVNANLYAPVMAGDIENLNVPDLVEFLHDVVALQCKLSDKDTAIDGTVLDMLRAKHGGDHVKMMHEFCRMPLLAPLARVPVAKVPVLMEVVGPRRVPMPGPKEEC